jgi:hypothetical protein
MADMGFDLTGSEGDRTALFIGTNVCRPMTESLFTAHEAVVKVLWLYCENCDEKIEYPRANQTSCGDNNCQQAIVRKRKKAEPWLPYYDIELNGVVLPHVMMSITKRECALCGKWCAPGRLGRFCSRKCHTKIRDTYFKPLTTLDLE